MKLLDVYNDVLKEIDGIRGVGTSFDSSSSFSSNQNQSQKKDQPKKKIRRPKMQSAKPLNTTDTFERN